MQITNLSDSESGSKLSIPERQKLLAALLHFDKDNLTNSQVQLLTDHIMSYHDVFALQDHERGKVEKVTNAIDTQDHPPIYQPSRRIPFAQRKEMLKLVNDMMQYNVIEKFSSPWSSPVVLVKKKDGQLRFCVDYRRLNAITHKDVFPVPRIDDMLDQLSGKKVFSTLDAKSGYWQVPLEETSRSKTAFSTSNGLYQFCVMPFGLCNAPATFQRVIQQILSGLGGSSPFCCAYIDNILVFSDNIEQHMQHLQQVFERVRSAGLLLHPKKCQFAQGSTTYLGHVITGNGILPDPNKTRAVQDFPIPTLVKAVRQFRIIQLLPPLFSKLF